jgi:hypothetical protein
VTVVDVPKDADFVHGPYVWMFTTGVFALRSLKSCDVDDAEAVPLDVEPPSPVNVIVAEPDV